MAFLRLITLVGSLLLAAPLHAQTIQSDLAVNAKISRKLGQDTSVRQAAIALAARATTDVDGYALPPAPAAGATLTGGGRVPPASGAPVTDGYGVHLGYCAWDNGTSTGAAGYLVGANGLDRVTLSVVSPGNNNSFETSCAQIAAGTAAQGDDYYVAYTAGQILAGVQGSTYFADPVNTVADLSLIAASALKDGQVRLVKADNGLYKYQTSTATWVRISASQWQNGSPSDDIYFDTGSVAIGRATAVNTFTVRSAGVPVGLQSTGNTNGTELLNAATAAREALFGFDTAGNSVRVEATKAGSAIALVTGGGSVGVTSAGVLNAPQGVTTTGIAASGAITSASLTTSGAVNTSAIVSTGTLAVTAPASTFSGTVGVAGVLSASAGMTSTDGAFSGTVSAAAMTVGGNSVWHAGNFNPINYVAKTGDTMTGALQINVGGGVNSATAGVSVVNGTSYGVATLARMQAGNYNPLVLAGDSGHIFMGGALNAAAGYVIAPWSSSASGLRMTSDGSVGIGTSTPSHKLDVNGSIRTSSRLYSESTTNSAAVLASFQNLSTGTAAQGLIALLNDAGALLQVGANGSSYAGSAATGNAGEAFVRSTGTATGLWLNATAGALRFGTTNAERMQIDSSGQVGFGITPAYKFHVESSGGINVTNGTGRARIYTDGTDTYVGSVNTGDLVLQTSGTGKVRIDETTGNVGIGTGVGAPLAKLVVDRTGGSSIAPAYTASTVAVFQGSSAASGASIVNLTAGNTGISALYFGDTDSEASGQIRYLHNGDSMGLYANGAEFLRGTSNGNVAIGHPTPSARLHVESTTAGGLVDEIYAVNRSLTASTEAGIFFAPTNVVDGSRGARISAINSGTNAIDMRFWTGNGAAPVERMRLMATGQLGIGTATPSAFLSVDRLAGASVVPAISAGTIATFASSSTPATNAAISIISGNTGSSTLYLGDSDSESTGYVRYNNGAATMVFAVEGGSAYLTPTGMGVGTASPASRLHAFDNTAILLTLERPVSTTNAIIDFKLAGGSVYAGQGNSLSFAVGGASDLTNVGNQWFKVTSTRTTLTPAVDVVGTNPTLRVGTAANGYGSVIQAMPGLQLTAQGMNTTTAKYTPAISFASTDPDLTTTSPKTGALIVAEATEGYAADTAGGMALTFWTQPNAPGTTGALAERLRIGQTGLVSVSLSSTAAATQTLQVYGSALATGGFATGSDSRLKHDIKTMTYQDLMQRFMGLRAVDYVMNGDPENRRTMGFIAQELQPLFPDVVQMGANGYLGVSYSQMIPVVTAVVQEQQRQIEQLQQGKLDNDVGRWIASSDKRERLYFERDGRTVLRGHGDIALELRNAEDTSIARFRRSGDLDLAGLVNFESPRGGFAFNPTGSVVSSDKPGEIVVSSRQVARAAVRLQHQASADSAASVYGYLFGDDSGVGLADGAGNTLLSARQGAKGPEVRVMASLHVGSDKSSSITMAGETAITASGDGSLQLEASGGVRVYDPKTREVLVNIAKDGAVEARRFVPTEVVTSYGDCAGKQGSIARDAHGDLMVCSQ